MYTYARVYYINKSESYHINNKDRIISNEDPLAISVDVYL